MATKLSEGFEDKISALMRECWRAGEEGMGLKNVEKVDVARERLVHKIDIRVRTIENNVEWLTAALEKLLVEVGHHSGKDPLCSTCDAIAFARHHIRVARS